jgi:hypothetical protein
MKLVTIFVHALVGWAMRRIVDYKHILLTYLSCASPNMPFE